MKRVLAVSYGSGVYLSKDEQIDEFLSNGFTLYLVDNGKREVLATPEDGFLMERPALTEVKTFNMKG